MCEQVLPDSAELCLELRAAGTEIPWMVLHATDELSRCCSMSDLAIRCLTLVYSGFSATRCYKDTGLCHGRGDGGVESVKRSRWRGGAGLERKPEV
eukprot:3174671-Rhodomonas_salina.1